MKPRLLSDFGELLSYEAVFVGGTDIRDMSGMESKLDSGKEILIVSALAGGIFGMTPRELQSVRRSSGSCLARE
ncbi:MAG: hypothetical protein AB8B50_09660 [Pirellulaceae bacterium]